MINKPSVLLRRAMIAAGLGEKVAQMEKTALLFPALVGAGIGALADRDPSTRGQSALKGALIGGLGSLGARAGLTLAGKKLLGEYYGLSQDAIRNLIAQNPALKKTLARRFYGTVGSGFAGLGAGIGLGALAGRRLFDYD